MSDDPLGELERALVAAARRRSGALGSPPRAQAKARSGVLAVAFTGFAAILVLAVLMLIALH